jgi:DNA excision repair protein ERCC-4
LKGGVLFGTSFVLIVDLLKKRLPPHLISGFIIANAEHITETSTEVFILRFYRQTNKVCPFRIQFISNSSYYSFDTKFILSQIWTEQNGFIKAFSDNPIAFTTGFHKVEKVMKSLYLTKLFLWPRYIIS